MNAARRNALLALGLALLAAPAVAPAAEGPGRPNVLFLFSDDHRADAIGALGGAGVRTPNLDALARRGTILARAYCNGSMQGAVCVPSRAMLLTGRGLFRADEKMSEPGSTWPEAFAEAGYDTFATGKWHNGPGSLRRSFRRAEAVFLGGMGDPYALPLRERLPDGTLGPARPGGRHSVEAFADAAARFLRGRRDQDAPFLCYVAFNAPHDPRVAPAEYRGRYRDEDVALPANFLPEHPFDNGEMDIRDEKLAPRPRTPEVVRRHLADYFAAIEHLDAQVGRILDALRDAGRLDDTIVAFAGDHGLAIGSHGLLGKQNLYEHSMRAPAILAGPGVPAGRRVDALAYLHDLFPTLGELAGVPGPAGSEGLSLVPVFEGRTPSRRDDVLTAYRDVQRAICERRWKLIAYPRIGKVQLFDLEADPDELRDLSTDPACAAERERLLDLLRRRRVEAGDPTAGEAPPPR